MTEERKKSCHLLGGNVALYLLVVGGVMVEDVKPVILPRYQIRYNSNFDKKIFFENFIDVQLLNFRNVCFFMSKK